MPNVWCEGSFFWGERPYFASASQRGVRNQGTREQSKRGDPKGPHSGIPLPPPSLKSIRSPRVQFRLCHSLRQVTFFPLSFPICKMKASPQIGRLWPSWRRRKAHRLEMGDRRETQQNAVGKGAGEQNTVKRRSSSPSPGTQQRAVGNVPGPSPAAVGQEQSHTPLTALASPLSKGWGRRA